MTDFLHNYQHFILPISILTGAFVLTRLLRWFLNRYFRIASEKLQTDPTNYVYLKNVLSFVIYLLAVLFTIYSIPPLKSVAVTLFASAGILVAIVGFASQQAFANIISGLFIVIFKPYRVGDLVQVQGNTGEVVNITLRHTVIKDFHNQRVIIPNSVISNETVINHSIEDSKICRFIEVSISYNSDVDKAKNLMREAALTHPILNLDNQLKNEEIDVRLVDFEESGVKLRLMVWIQDPYKAWKTHHDLNETIKKLFQANGIEIPYPHRTIINK